MNEFSRIKFTVKNISSNSFYNQQIYPMY